MGVSTRTYWHPQGVSIRTYWHPLEIIMELLNQLILNLFRVHTAGGVAGSVTGVLRYDSIRGVAVGGDLGGC